MDVGQEPVPGGERLARQLLTDVRGLAARVTARLAAESPVYRRLPAEELDGDIRRIVEQNIRQLALLLQTGRTYDDEGLAEVRASAVRRAEEGVPIEAVVGAYHLGARMCLDELLPASDPAEAARAAIVLLESLRMSVPQVVAGYLEERQAQIGESDAAHQTLLSALLDGRDVEGVARRTGTHLPACYLVLAMAIGLHPDESDPAVDAAVAARRKIRRVRTELERRTGTPLLARITAGEGLVLLPRPAGADAASPEERAWSSALAEGVARAAGVPVVAGAVGCTPEGAAGAARLSVELREVAVVFRRPPGVYRLADLLVEYQLTRPGPARDQLAELLRPVVARPGLLPTLRLYLDTGLNRRQTATALRVHPNTVDYRIRRIAALTGLDTTDHTDRLKLTAALAAHDSEQAAPAMAVGGPTR
ncbi:PucR family transcriptional regulator [Spirillospora sp. NPDC127200]